MNPACKNNEKTLYMKHFSIQNQGCKSAIFLEKWLAHTISNHFLILEQFYVKSIDMMVEFVPFTFHISKYEMQYLSSKAMISASIWAR